MKKLVMLLLSVNALYAMDKTNEEYPDQNAMVKPLPVEHAPAVKKQDLEEKVLTDAEKMRSSINAFLESEEVKAVKGAIYLGLKVGWEQTKPFFYDEKNGTQYRNICVVGAIGLLWVAKRRFSGVGRLNTRFEKNHTLVMNELQEIRNEIKESSRVLGNQFADNSLKTDQRINKLVAELQRGPSAP